VFLIGHGHLPCTAGAHHYSSLKCLSFESSLCRGMRIWEAPALPSTSAKCNWTNTNIDSHIGAFPRSPSSSIGDYCSRGWGGRRGRCSSLPPPASSLRRRALGPAAHSHAHRRHGRAVPEEKGWGRPAWRCRAAGPLADRSGRWLLESLSECCRKSCQPLLQLQSLH